MAKADKEDVNYSNGMTTRHCGPMYGSDTGYCTHFIPGSIKFGDGTCEEVKGGIKPSMWCRLWKKHEKR